MIGDPWPEEPDEPLVEKYQHDDEGERTEASLAPDPPDAEAAPPELRRAFWGLVATLNLALFATALGAMLVGFRGQLREGGAVFLLGVAAFAYAGHRYRRYRDGGWRTDGD